MFHPSGSSRTDDKDFSAPASSVRATKSDSPRTSRGTNHELTSEVNPSSNRYTDIRGDWPMFPSLPKKPRSYPTSMQQQSDSKREDVKCIEKQIGHALYQRDTNDSDRGARADKKTSSRANERHGMKEMPETKSKGTIRQAGAHLQRTGQEEVRKPAGEKRGKGSLDKMLQKPSESAGDSGSAIAPMLGAHNLSVVIFTVEPGEVGLRLPQGATPAAHAYQWSLFLRTSVSPEKGIGSVFHRVCGRYLYTEAHQSLPPRLTPGFRKEEPLGFINPENTLKYLDVIRENCIRDGPHPWNAKEWILEVIDRLYLRELLPMVEYRSTYQKVSAMRV